MKTETQEQPIAASPDKRELWDQFREDRELIDRLKITSQELDTLGKCALLGTLTCKQDLLFILRQIREATTPGTPQAVYAAPTAAAYEESNDDERTAPDLSRFRVRLATPAAATDEPGSLAQITRRRLPEQFGVTFWAVVLAAGVMWNLAMWMARWRESFLSSIGAPALASAQSAPWFTQIDEFKALIAWEILFVVGASTVLYALHSRKRPRRLKVKPI